MFGWLTRLFKRKDPALFTFWDGQQMRSADPLELWNRLVTNPVGDIDDELTACDVPHPTLTEGDKESETAYRQHTRMQARAKKAIAEIIMYTLEVKSYNEGGLTMLQLEEEFNRLHEFLAALKKKQDAKRITSPPSGSNGAASSQRNNGSASPSINGASRSSENTISLSHTVEL